MIGNDLIDKRLAFAERKSANKRFINKVFTPTEKTIISGSENAETNLWLLWSMKEAAYKAHQRRFSLKPILNPIDFNCRLLNSHRRAEVIIENYFYSVQYNITEKYIHSIALASEQKLLQKIYSFSANANRNFLKDFSLENNLEEQVLEIKKDYNGIPSILLKKSGEEVSFSKSHHGNFTAFVFPLIKS